MGGKEKIMADTDALAKVLPYVSLEPSWVAIIDVALEPVESSVGTTIALLEPPAHQSVPYIEPAAAMKVLLRRRSLGNEAADTCVNEVFARMQHEIADEHWISFMDGFDEEPYQCLPSPEFLRWLRKDKGWLTDWGATDQDEAELHDILCFIENAAMVTARTPIFCWMENRSEKWSLEQAVTFPPSPYMIEFMPIAPWLILDWKSEKYVPGSPFMQWFEIIKPVALELEKVLGKRVYVFADPDDECDDDYVHRFIALHWCCSYAPESAFVRYLVKVSGAKDVEDLKAALIDPANYTQPFDGYREVELSLVRFRYLHGAGGI